MTWVVEHSARSVLACLVPVVLLACGPGKPPETGEEEGTGGSSTAARGGTGSGAAGAGNSSNTGGTGQGGSISPAGGASASGGSGGDPATSGSGSGAESGAPPSVGGAAGSVGDGGTGAVPIAGSGGTGTAGSAGGPSVCQQLSVVPTPQVPVVSILVDTSSSMFETTPPTWPLLYDALMDETTGVVHALADKIRFGFASYKGAAMATTEDNNACAEMVTVEPALDNRAAIDAVYGPIAWPTSHPKWETPTGHAIARTSAALQAFMPDPPGPKFILLLTDGNPNTCQVLDPQCGQDLSIKAAQDAYAAGVGLFVLGVGDIVAQPNNGCPTSGRCGPLHLQDLANAGVGAPVHSPADNFRYESCNQGQLLLSTYTPDAPDVGTPFAVDTRSTDAQTRLVSTLTGLLANVISCTVEMDARVTGDPSLGMVSVGGSPVAYGAADGWNLDMATLYNVTLTGAACDTFKGGATLDIQFPCDPSGKPIAVRR